MNEGREGRKEEYSEALQNFRNYLPFRFLLCSYYSIFGPNSASGKIYDECFDKPSQVRKYEWKNSPHGVLNG